MASPGLSLTSISLTEVTLKPTAQGKLNIFHLIPPTSLVTSCIHSLCINIAWLLSKSDNITPIPGTKRRKYLEENASSVDIELTKSEVQVLEEVAPLTLVKGTRYPEAGMKVVNR